MRKLLVVLALVGLAGGSIFCGSSNSSTGGTSGGSDAGGSGSDAGTGGSDAGTDGGSDGGVDAGTDGGTGGSDAGTDGGSDAGTDGGSDGGTDGGTGGNYANACSTFTTNVINKFADCQKATTAFMDTLKQTLFMTDYCGETGRAIASGRARYDDSKASACITAIQAASCATLQATVDASPCSDVLKGTVAAGGACYDDVDCAAGTCDASSLTCPGKCVAYVTVAGNACNTGGAGDCAPGLTCQTNVCVATSAAGGPCPCKEGLYCDTSSVCQPKKTGGSCGGDSECALGTACVGGSCRGLVGVNSPCTPASGNNFASTECGFMGAYCEPSTSKCTEWPVVGGSCAASYACRTGYCDFLATTPTCVAFRTVGQSCDPLSRCVSSAYCDIPTGAASGSCTALKANGAACTSNGQCQSGDCAIPSGQTQGQCKAACVEP